MFHIITQCYTIVNMSDPTLALMRYYLQIILLFTILTNLGLVYYGVRTNKFALFGYVTPILTWLIHGLLFYVYVLFIKPAGLSEIGTTWSFVLRLHLAFLILGGLIIEVFFDHLELK